MEAMQNTRGADHLVNLILTRNADVPNFALLLGSGASATSKVNTAGAMIDDWRRQLYQRSRMRESLSTWLTKQEWYDSDDEYSLLFELVYDQPSQRRVYIEECLKNAHPSWGYVYLTNLLKANVFNVVFTTNFDDLINEACFLYSDGLRPIVCAHDSAVSGIRVTSARPKIIKLHGDFLFDNIKNAVRELETLEDNIKRKIMQFAQEYGLVVIGYSGRDRSVMDVLDMLVKSEQYFAQGIYWCLPKGAQIGERLGSLLRRDRVFVVEISGFDECMAHLHNRAGFDLPTIIANPLRVARDRVRLFLDIPPQVRKDEIISRDIEKVLASVGDIMSLSEVVSTPEGARVSESSQRLLRESLPLSFRAAAVRQVRDLEGALDYLQKAVEEDPQDLNVAYDMADVLARLHRRDELKAFIPQSAVSDQNKTYFLLHADDNEGVIEMADRILSNDPIDQIARINRAIALKRLGRSQEMEGDLVFIESLKPPDDIRAGIAALRKNKGELLPLLEVACDKGLLSTDNIETYVVFEDYWEDKDLLKFVEKRKQKE